MLSACSKSKESPSANSLVLETRVESLKEANALAKLSTIECSLESCPSAIALSIGTSPTSLLRCTSFLVSEQLVLTNSHCIPSRVKMLPDTCPESMEFVFPAGENLPEERVRCGKLIARTERPNSISPDLALVELAAPVNRKSFEPSPFGIAPNEFLTAWKLAPKNAETFQVQKSICVAKANSYRFPLYRDSDSPVVLLGDCDSQETNSGSPLINSQGKAVGVLQATWNLQELERKNWIPFLREGETFSSFALGTSLKCLLLPEGKINPNCPEEISAEEVQDARPRISDFLGNPEFSYQLNQILHPYLHQSEELEWKRLPIQNRNLTRLETLTPSCLKPLDQWIHRYMDVQMEEAIIQAVLPVVEIRTEFNRYLQASPRLQLIEEYVERFRFSPRKLLKQGEEDFFPMNRNRNQNSEEPIRLKICN